jgi:hypothetical protein
MTTKYKSKAVEIDGYVFQSKIEAKYYEHLKWLLEHKEIKSFSLQPRYILLDKFKKNEKTKQMMLRGGKMSAVIKANKVKLNDYGYEIDKTIPEIEKRENEPKNEQIKTDNIDWKAIVVETVDELREEYEREIENLKKEVIDAHKLVTEWQEKYKKLREQFSDALMVKDHAIKENAELENERLKLERENTALARELDSLRKEKAVLVEFSYLKLAKEVETA